MRIRHLATAATLGLVALTAACAQQPGSMPAASMGPTDTGNMAYPAPRATGELTRPAPVNATNTGSMAYPNNGRPGQTSRISPQDVPRDTGNMAYPQPSPIGTLRSTTTQ